MAHGPENSLSFIRWKPEYECIISVINCQHRDTLAYLNTWFSDIKLMRVAPEKASSYLVEKMRYLKHFCGQHLAFEEDVMTLLAMNYGFSQSDYNAHVQSHANFSRSLLTTLSDQIDYFVKGGDSTVIEELVVESLKDVAKWWYYHIADSDKNSKIGHDYVYRQHIKTLSQEQQLSLLNEIITKAELAE